MKFSSLSFYFLNEIGSKGNLSPCAVFWVLPQGLILNYYFSLCLTCCLTDSVIFNCFDYFLILEILLDFLSALPFFHNFAFFTVCFWFLVLSLIILYIFSGLLLYFVLFFVVFRTLIILLDIYASAHLGC